jgi:hypothetical protein
LLSTLLAEVRGGIDPVASDKRRIVGVVGRPAADEDDAARSQSKAWQVQRWRVGRELQANFDFEIIVCTSDGELQ